MKSRCRILTFFLALLLLTSCFSFAGAEKTQLTFSFAATADSKPTKLTVDWDEDWFDAPSSQYNQKIAQLSIGMAVTAFRDNKVELSNSDHYLRAFFETAGFEGYTAYHYNEQPSDDSISNGIAYRRMQDEQGPYVLLAVAICGQGYGDEWLSNFTVGSSEDHQGFYSAAMQVLARIQDYIATNLPGEKIKIWVTGFSRAAAVSNMLGDRLLLSGLFDEDNVFVYTFGTPNTTENPNAWPQIFNIAGSFDPVPKIPFADWGFGKHGTTLYLPSRATDPDYDLVEPAARKTYAAIMGTEENFASLPERNWLLVKVLQLLYEYIPESSGYVAAYQDAIIAAWRTKGTPADKLRAMSESLAQHGNVDMTAFNRISGELGQLLDAGIGETLGSATGKGGNEIWFSLLTSGKMLAHEHFPEEYLAWMLSTDNPEDLFSQGSNYTRLVYTGYTACVISATDPETGEEISLKRDDGTLSLAYIQIQGETFISLPAGRNYTLVLTADEEEKIQIGYAKASIALVGLPLTTTNTITLYPEETITITVPADAVNGEPSAVMDGSTDLPFFSAENGESSKELLLSGSTTSNAMGKLVSSAVVIIPYLVSALGLLLYSIVVLVKRLIRKSVDDHVQCRPAGKVLLLITSGFSLTLAVLSLLTLISTVNQYLGVAIENRTLVRVSEFLGISVNAYHLSSFTFYLILAFLCYHSIRHEFSRIRAVRLSLLMLVLNLLALFVACDIGTLSIMDLLAVLPPILTLISLITARIRTDVDTEIGKRWIPAMRVLVLTFVLFSIRQLLILVEGVGSFSAILLKALCGLPVVVYALMENRKKKSRLHLWTALALAVYFVGNTVANLSTPAATVLFFAGHCLAIWGFIQTHKPEMKQFLLWGLLSALLIMEALLIKDNLPDRRMLVPDIIYSVILAGMVSASFGVSRRCCVASLMMLFANELLILTFLFPGNFALESAELLIYYIATLILAIDPSTMAPRGYAKKSKLKNSDA